MAVSPSITNSCRHCTARCCRGLAVVLTIPEAKRLVAATGLPPTQMLEFSSNVDSKQTPHYPLLVKRGGVVEEYFILLKRHRKAECVFLSDDMSCAIYGDRPYVCRLYPFELDGKKVKKGALCPVKFAREANLEADAKALQQDLLQHGKLARQWHSKYGKEAPDMRKFKEYFGD